MTADITYAATVTSEAIIITENRRAGICGPCGEIPLPEGFEFGMDMDELAALIRTRRYAVTGPWKAVRSYEGLWLEATVQPV